MNQLPRAAWRHRPLRRVLWAVLVCLPLLIATVGWAPATASADASRGTSYTLTARSDVATIEYYRSDVPVIPPRPVLFHSPSTAQARLDSLGTSQALASAPEPGAFGREIPDETAGVSEGQIEPPRYPFAVRSSFPTEPDHEIEQGPYRLLATSDQHESTAHAQLLLAIEEAPLTRSRADARVASTGDAHDRVAEATAWLDLLAVGDVLRISDVRSSARLSLDAEGTPSTATSTTVGAITVNGIAVTLDEEGIALNDDPIAPIDSDALAGQLRAAGIQLRYLPAVEESDFVLSAAIEVSLAEEDSAGATQELVITLGRVSATGTASAASFTGVTDLPEVAEEAPPRVEDPSPAPVPAPAVPDDPTEVATPLSMGAGGTTGSGPEPSPPPPVVAAAPDDQAPPGALARQAPTGGVYTSLFLTVALAGLAATVSARLLGVLGVRLRLA